MKKFLLIGLVMLGIAAHIVAVHANPALAAAKDEVCAGVGAVSGSGGCATKTGEPTVNGIISAVVNILSAIVGVVAVIFVIYSGFKYITAGGDSGKISSAKNTLIYAIVGLVVAALARPLVQFVLTEVL